MRPSASASSRLARIHRASVRALARLPGPKTLSASLSSSFASSPYATSGVAEGDGLASVASAADHGDVWRTDHAAASGRHALHRSGRPRGRERATRRITAPAAAPRVDEVGAEECARTVPGRRTAYRGPRRAPSPPPRSWTHVGPLSSGTFLRNGSETGGESSLGPSLRATASAAGGRQLPKRKRCGAGTTGYAGIGAHTGAVAVPAAPCDNEVAR